ncbi:hypothetical protein Tco_0791459 [Tanacetum coccineum]
MQQPMPNLEDITDPTTTMNMALVLMAKAFKLNYSTTTNNNQRISSNPRNRQIAQLDMNLVQNTSVQNVGNHNGLIVVLGIVNPNVNQNGNGNVLVARAEGNVIRNNADLDKIEKSAKVQLYDNCYNIDIFNMFTQEKQYTELLEPIPKPHQVQQNDSNVISEVSSVEQGGGTVEQHPETVEETHAYFESLYNNLAIEVEKVNTVNLLLEKHDPPAVYDSEETLQLAQESRLKMKQLNKEIKPENYTKINHLSEVFVSQTAKSREELYFSNTSKTANVSKSISIPNEEFSDDTTPSVARKFLNESAKFQNTNLKEASNFIRDFKSLVNEADESLAKHKAFEFEIERLLRAVVSQDIMSIVQTPTVVETSDLQTKLEQYKYDKISYDKAYNGMQQKIKRLQAQLGDLKGKCKDTLCVSDTLDPLSQKLENANVELEFQVGETNDLSNPVTSNSVPTTTDSKVVTKDKVIAPGMFRINSFKTSRADKFVPINKVRASVMKNPITVSQPHVITKKDVNSDSNGSSSIGVDNTARTKRLQLRSNIKNDRVPSASKISCIKNKEVEVEEHHRNLLLSKNKKHMSSECNNVKLDIHNDKSEVVKGMNSRGKKQKANVSNIANQTKLKPKVRKPNKVMGLGQFCDSDLEVAFRRNTCFIRNLEGVDLLKGNRTTNLYTINLHEMAFASPICLMAHATSTKSWL